MSKHNPNPTYPLRPHRGGYSIEQTLVIWLEQHESENTKRARRSDLKQFIEWLGGAEYIEGVSPSQAIHYAKYLRAQPGKPPRSDKSVLERRVMLNPGAEPPFYKPSPTTVNRKLDHLAALYKFLMNEPTTSTSFNPFSSSVVPREKPGVQKEPTEALTPQEVRLLFKQCDTRSKRGARDAAILACLFYCGMRVHEVASLNMGSLHFDEENPYLMLPVSKGGGVAEQVVSEDAVKMIEKWATLRRREGATLPEPLFVASRGKGALDAGLENRFSVIGMMKRVKRLAELAGVDKHVTSHSGRATAITHLLRQGYSPQDVVRFSRHSDIRMVMKYYKELFGREDNPGYNVKY